MEGRNVDFQSAAVDLTEIFPGQSEMARLMRAHDWSATSLGPPQDWPDGLKIPLKMLLTSRFEMWLGWGPDLLFFYNDSYIPTLGLKHPSMMGKPFREVWAEVYEDVADQVERVRAGHATWNDALLLLLERSGYPEETYHSFSYSPLYGEGSEVQGLLCVVSEETERVIGERRIETLRTLGMGLIGALEQSTVCDAACAALDSNRRDFPFALLFLRNESLACSPDAAHLLSHDWLGPDRASHDSISHDSRSHGDAGGQHATAIRRMRLPDGLDYPCGAWKRAPVEALVVPIPGAAGQTPVGSLLLALNPHRRDDPAVVDIARLLAGQLSGALANIGMLQSERRRADRVWSYSRDLMAVVNSEGVFQSVNPAWTRILGYSADDVTGRHYREFVLPDDFEATDGALEQALGSDDLTAFENRFRTRDGGSRWISWHTSMEEGIVYAYGRDITDQKAASQALKAAEDALRHAQKMEAVGQLTGGIAHDFNNLLTGIIGSLDMMKRRMEQSRLAEAERYAAAATVSANRAAALTQRLLAFARRQPLDPKSVDVSELVRGMDELIRRSIGETIDLRVIAPPGLWRTTCDPNQLESAILNLVINARDALPGGGTLTLETRNAPVDRHAATGQGRASDEYVTISVTDTGHGMPPDIAARAFEPFFTTKPIGKGTGLGLSMVYGFARQSGGFAEIDSIEGQGTSVTLYLPHDEEGRVDAVQSQPEPPAGDGARSETILVVEDEDDVRTLVVEALQDLGYETIEAIDASVGLSHLQSGAGIDLLLTDVVLPGGFNGRQLADVGLVLRPGLKVLLMTGYMHDAAIGNDRLEPGMEMMTKPFTVEKLGQRVRMILEAPAPAGLELRRE